jgi:cell division protein FtsI/penicillin-binding protein 2
VLVCVALLIHRSLKLARRAGHPFAFYLAAGIAIVTGVQFFVIVFGSIGFIPLTGVSVPFLSYGMSSLIINMAAYGVVVSVSRVRPTANQRQEVKKYDNVVIASMLTFMSFSLLLIGSLFYYQVVARDQYLVKPACVVNLDGAIDMEYNPRIDILMRHLDAGNIYDRNGLLLAASEADELTHNQAALMKAGADGRTLQRLVKKRLRRYYPFGDHFFFMLGDYNTRALWGSPEAMPVGYMAENRHLTELRGFDNVVRDGRGRPVKDVMTTNTYRESPFLPSVKRTLAFTRYDYSNPTLLAMLKGGIDSEEVKEWNAQRNRRDLTLTLDARLQVQLQKDMQNMIEKNSTWLSRRRLRASVVVLDAARGDLLCSANYPLPNQDSLRYLADQHKYVYNDHSLQQAYTDRDLGLTYQTQPGSTAKVMSAMAGLMRYGVDAANIKYQVRAQETVEPSSVEPWGNVTMNVAIVRSSNCYFVNLVHDKDLYPELQRIYTMTGVRIDHPRMRTTDAYASHTPYIFDMESFSDSLDYGSEMQYLQNLGLKTYRDYVEHRQSQKKYERMAWWQCALAWGQGTLTATPLNMARVVSVVANDGQFVPTRYVLQRGTGASAVRQPVNTSIPVLSSQAAGLLKSYMQQESDKHRRQGRALPQPLNPLLRMGGKTGTPERVSGGAMEARRDQNGRRYWAYPCMNDGWYVFFIRSERQQGPLAVAVRLERLGIGSGNTSGAAVEFVANTVIPSLNRAGYKVN